MDYQPSHAERREPNIESNPMPGRVSVEEFTEATFNAVLRALDARKLPNGPLIYGIIYLPEGLKEGVGSSNPRSIRGI